MEEATAPAWIERISPLDDQALADRYMLHKLLGMPDAALADAMELQRRQARKSGRPDPDYANSVAYYLADFPDYLPQAEAQARRSIRAAGLRPYNQATLGWIRFLRGDAAGGLDMLKRGYAAQPRDEEMVADYGLALWRDGQQALARRIWDQAEAQCVWGRRLYDALRAVDYPHPLFHASGSAQVQAYQQLRAAPADPRQTPSARRGRLRRTAPAIPARAAARAAHAGSGRGKLRALYRIGGDRRQAGRQHLFRRDAVDARADDVGHDINGARTLPEPFGVGLVEHAHVRHAHALRDMRGPQSLATIRRARSISADSSGMVRQYSIRNSGRRRLLISSSSAASSGPSTKENCVPRPIEVLSRSASRM